MYKTDTLCPQSGVYIFARHVRGISCDIDHSNEKITMRKFDLFPAIKSCKKSAFWIYVKEK